VVRRTLLVATAAWLAIAVAGLVVAAIGREALLAALPPLAIDADALGGAVAVIAAAALLVGLAHGLILAGLGRHARWARSAGVLLASVLSVAFLGLAATAVTSALREAVQAPALAGGAVGAGVVAAVYGLTAARLVTEMGSGSAV
jgi:hypothetical protein